MSKLRPLRELIKRNSILNDSVMDITLDAFEKEAKADERQRIKAELIKNIDESCETYWVAMDYIELVKKVCAKEQT